MLVLVAAWTLLLRDSLTVPPHATVVTPLVLPADNVIHEVRCAFTVPADSPPVQVSLQQAAGKGLDRVLASSPYTRTAGDVRATVMGSFPLQLRIDNQRGGRAAQVEVHVWAAAHSQPEQLPAPRYAEPHRKWAAPLFCLAYLALLWRYAAKPLWTAWRSRPSTQDPR